MDELIDQIAKASTAVKLGVVGGAVALVTALNFFVVGIPFGPSVNDIDTKLKGIARAQAQATVDRDNKTAIANDLNRFTHEKEELEQRLHEAESELPKDKNLDDLLKFFQDRAQKAGLEIVSIEPKGENVEGQYARIPIAMTVEGSFHEIATFFDALGRLRRIVNVSDIVLDSPRDANGRVVVKSQFTATAFRLVDTSAPDPKGAKGRAAK